jgi:hypothetical protein
MDVIHVMRPEEFDQQWDAIWHSFHQCVEALKAARDKALGQLFQESGWPQLRIAHHIGKSQSWVARRLTYARFGDYANHQLTLGYKAPALGRLTEGKFRGLWLKTDRKAGEEERFKDVFVQLDPNLRKKAAVPPSPKTLCIRAAHELEELIRPTDPHWATLVERWADLGTDERAMLRESLGRLQERCGSMLEALNNIR